MARKVDITDKLIFDGNPFIVIKGKELEVQCRRSDCTSNHESGSG